MTARRQGQPGRPLRCGSLITLTFPDSFSMDYMARQNIRGRLVRAILDIFDKECRVDLAVAGDQEKRIRALKLTNIAAYSGRNVTGFNVLNNSITGDKLTDEAGNSLVSEAVEASEDFTKSEISSVKAWVRTNFEPKA